MVASKLGKIVKAAGIGLLVVVSVIAGIQVTSVQLKHKTLIACDVDSTDTIIMTQERQRTRVFLDVLKKMMFINSPIKNAFADFRQLNSFEIKSLFMNAYQRNVFYVFAFSTVP